MNMIATKPVRYLGMEERMGAAQRAGVERLLFLGSSCIYPKFARQPITESSLMTGELEPTNDAYAVAKIADKQVHSLSVALASAVT